MAKNTEGVQNTLELVSKVSKDTKGIIQKTTSITREELKFIVGMYYQAQAARISTQNQIRALRQGYDEKPESASFSVLTWDYNNQVIREKELEKVIKLITDSSATGRWLKSIKGVGPVIAAGCLAYFDVTRVNYASQFISYAGYADQNRPWLGKEKSKKLVEEVIGDAKKITSDHIVTISARSGWKVEQLEKDAAKYDNDGNIIGYGKEALIKSISKIPYNKSLKVLMFKLGESFVKVSGKPDSLYGKLYKEFKAEQIRKNEAGEFAEQAAKALKEKNYGKDTLAYKAYSQGKLPDAHIQARAKRKAVTIFISHLFEQMWMEQYNTSPTYPYVFGEMGHRDYIKPEVPFTKGLSKPCNGIWDINLNQQIDTAAEFVGEEELNPLLHTEEE